MYDKVNKNFLGWTIKAWGARKTRRRNKRRRIFQTWTCWGKDRVRHKRSPTSTKRIGYDWHLFCKVSLYYCFQMFLFLTLFGRPFLGWLQTYKVCPQSKFSFYFYPWHCSNQSSHRVNLLKEKKVHNFEIAAVDVWLHSASL